MKKENKKSLFKINTEAIKKAAKSPNVKTALKDLLKTTKELRDSFDINQ